MPNWVRNRLTIHGGNAVKVMQSLLVESDIDGEYDFDFNKIVPMPPELNLTAGKVTQNCAQLYINSLEEYGEEYIKYAKIYKQAYKGDNVMLLNDEWRMLMKEVLSHHDIEAADNRLMFNSPNEALEYGKRALDNYAQYGAVDWYDWCRTNWGTKWNAHNTEVPDITNAVAYFDTAWSRVINLMQKLSAMHPECSFEYEYAEEEPGYIAGRYEFRNGAVTNSIEYEPNGKECYEKYFDLWGGADEFKFNEKTGTYEYIDEEEME